MKRAALLISSLLFVLLLSGCTGVEKANEIIVEQMQVKSGIDSIPEYKRYQEYKADGKLDEAGQYTSESDSEVDPNSIHVSFASNSNLEISYYSDSEFKKAIDIEDYYAKPKEDIFAKVSISDSVHTSEYEFSEFRIIEYKENGERKERDDLKCDFKNSGLVMRLTKDLVGKRFSIEPVGQFRMRKINLNDYYTDEAGSKNEIEGTWSINDKDTQDESIELNPISSYIISYKFDSNEFFFLNSSPTCYYSNNEDGVVVFDQRNAIESTEDYEIELHKYFDLFLVTDRDRKVVINGQDELSFKANTEVPLQKLKYGDRVVIETDKEWPTLENNKDVILQHHERTPEQGYRYTVLIPDKNQTFLFDPDDYTYEHGTIEFSCFGSIVTNAIPLEKGRKIVYGEKSAEEGYWLSGDDHFVIVTDEEETRKNLEAIHFTPKVSVEVSLPQPQYGGDIQYFLNGERIKGDSVTSYSGEEVTMSFNHWQGWISNYKDGEIYRVREDQKQSVLIDGKVPGKDCIVFTEDEAHKPELTFVLEESVGSDMRFKITAGGGYSSAVESYKGGWKVTNLFNDTLSNVFNNDKTIIKEQKIGTERNIEIDISNKSIQAGKALRLLIQKTIDDGKELKEIVYVENITNTIVPIEIYSSGSNGNAKEWYNSIVITAGIVDVEEFEEKSSFPHSELIVKNAETEKKIKAGDLVEPSQKIIVKLAPESGYFISGPKVKGDVYQESMEYSEFKKKITSIIDQHSAEKYYTITLDDSDAHAKYTYKLDGVDVSGVVSVKKGQKLKLTYEITDDNYKLKKPQVSILVPGVSFKKTTKTLTISLDMDGKTITKEDFDIEVVKGR